MSLSKENHIELIIETIARSIKSIADNDTVYDPKDVDFEELKDFVSNFPVDKIKLLEEFFDSTPYLIYQDKVSCPTEEKLLEVKDIQDFFI